MGISQAKAREWHAADVEKAHREKRAGRKPTLRGKKRNRRIVLKGLR